MYPQPVSHPTTVSLLASAMHAVVASAVPQPSLALGTLRTLLDFLGFDQARAVVLDGLQLISTSR